MLESDLKNRFDYHPPKDSSVANSHAHIRADCLSLALNINDLVPESREKHLAITKLEEVMYWANAAIARN